MVLKYSFVLFFLFALALAGKIPHDPTKQDSEDRTWILDWEAPAHIKNKFIYYLSGYDYENKPVVVMEWGKWDFQEVAEKGGEDLENSIIILDQLLDRIQAGYFRSNDSQCNCTENEVAVIVDFNGLKLRQMRSPPTFKLMLERMAKMGSIYNYLAYGFIINANPLVDQVINLAKPFIGNFLEKMEIYGTSSRKWMPQILKKIPRSELHPAYGGYKEFKPLVVYG